MKQVVLTAPYTFELRETAIPTPKHTEVLLKVHAVGICGSDIQMVHGQHRYMTYPVITGHEVGAEVAAVGHAVRHWKVGQRVTVEPQISCGVCHACRIGRFNVCESLKVMGVHADGFMAEYVVVEERFLHLCPDDMPFDLISLVEPVAVGIGSVKRSRFTGANVAVVGAGTIGNLVAQAAKALGAGDVLICDIIDKKLDYARACGIGHCQNIREIGLGQAILDAFGPRQADVIVDAAATASSFQAILDASRSASEIVITGNYKQPVELELPRLQRREVNLLGHMMYVREDFEDAIRLISGGDIKVDGFITQRFSPEAYAEAFDFIDRHPLDVIKMIVEF